MKSDIMTRIDAMRAQMRGRGIDAVIVPQTDPHQSEYLAEHWQVRSYLSGFTGSAGSLVITDSEALLWTDSRYFIQAADQLQGTSIRLMKDGLPDTPTIYDYLIQVLSPGSTVGIDGMLFSALSVEQMIDIFGAHAIKLVTDFDVVDEIWASRPSLPKSKIFVHDVKYVGESAAMRLSSLRETVREVGADAVFISPLDEIAWLLNIRCDDVRFNPVATSYLYVSASGATLFIDTDKVDDDVKEYLSSIDVDVEPYDKVKAFVAALPQDLKVAATPKTTSATIARELAQRMMPTDSLVAVPKALRNEVQIDGLRSAMERDGVAMVRAIMALEKALKQGERITEMGVDALLRKYRSEQPLFFDESFGSIVGYGPHGAIVHYEATEETDVELHPQGLLLIDSGAQYLDGTTDITRTISLGDTPTELEKHDFTLVLKGMIALDMMVFPKGTRGAQLDVEARKYLWREGLGYLHGTGHGVGHFLNVHEGPQTIRLNDTPIPMMETMVTSDEPGLYREGVHGVRCENLVLCVKAMTTEFGEFLKFETLTLFPFDTRLMAKEIMSPEEIAWVNDYHAEVRRRLSPYLTADECAWLETKTNRI